MSARFPFTKGDRVRDREGHEGEVVNIYLLLRKARVRWHKGYATSERVADLTKIEQQA